MITVLFVGAVALWLLLNWLAPFATLARAERMPLGRVPIELVAVARQHRARLYVAPLVRLGGYSVLAWPWRLVIFDREFFTRASGAQVRFLIAHELGHCALGHLEHRWLATVSGTVLLPAVRRRLDAMEREADDFARQLTGITPREFYQLKGDGA